MYVDPDKLPLIIVTNGSLNGIYDNQRIQCGNRRYAAETAVTDITDIYRRNTGRIMTVSVTVCALCKSCEIIAVVQMLRI